MARYRVARQGKAGQDWQATEWLGRVGRTQARPARQAQLALSHEELEKIGCSMAAIAAHLRALDAGEGES